MACHAAASAAVTHVRAGNGPYLLEFATYRWREHCGPSYDDDLGYRPASEVEAWRSECPILRAEERLSADGSDINRLRTKARTDIAAEITAAFDFARESSFPVAAEAYTPVYAP